MDNKMEDNNLRSVWLITSGSMAHHDWRVESIHATEEGAKVAKEENDDPLFPITIEEWELEDDDRYVVPRNALLALEALRGCWDFHEDYKAYWRGMLTEQARLAGASEDVALKTADLIMERLSKRRG